MALPPSFDTGRRLSDHCSRLIPRRIFGLALLALTGLAGLAGASEVSLFAPQGQVKAVRQVSARFTGQMVAFGDPREVAPFDIDCPAPGRGRWADGHNWLYDFDDDLPAGLRCRFKLKPGLSSVDGRKLAGGDSFEFSTGGPAILHSEPEEGDAIDEHQVFILGLDAKTKLDSVRRHAACYAEGLPERLPVRILEGKERKTILDQRQRFLTQYFRLVFVGAEGSQRSLIVGVPDKGSAREKFLKLRDDANSPIVVLQCQRSLPAGAKFRLSWGAGIETASGIATDKAQDLAFKVRRAFSARFTCERMNKTAQCIPVLAPVLQFTAPIRLADARQIRLSAEGQTWPAQIAKDDEKGGFVERLTFAAPLPEKTAFKLEIPAGLKDDAGRSLSNGQRFPMTIHTDEYPPLVKFPARFGIIELSSTTPPLLPVTLRNVEAKVAASLVQAGIKANASTTGQALKLSDETQVIAWLKRLRAVEDPTPAEAGRGKSPGTGPGSRSVFSATDQRSTFQLPKPLGAKAFEVIGIPLKGAGFHVVELASPRLGKALLAAKQPYYVQSAALVTNLAVHFKQGRESSLVWVTSLDKGQPVAGAEVQVRDCKGQVFVRGKTGNDGILRINKALPERDSLPGCLEDYDRSYFVTARQGGDFSFVLSDWNEGIAPWRFNLFQGNRGDSTVAHAVFDRSLLKAGETVHMKLFLRRQVGSGLSAIDFAAPEKLDIVHTGSDQHFQTSAQWAKDGSAVAEWAIPADAKQGSYEVRLASTGKRGKQEWLAGSFRVDAFRIPTMKAQLSGPRAPLVDADRADVDLQLSYLSGGAANQAPVRLRGQVLTRNISFPDYEEFTFANGDIKPGKRAGSDDADEEDDNQGAAEEDSEDSTKGGRMLAVQSLQLDKAGAARGTFTGLPKSDRPQDLLAEMEFRDANGETVTRAARIPLWTAKLIAGIKPDGWVSSPEKLRFYALALDLEGKPQAGAKISVDAFQREYYSYRRRLVGGFYAYDHSEEVSALGPLCQGLSDARGLLLCEAKAPIKGNIILRATVTDQDGHVSSAHTDTWVAGGDDWFDTADHDRMDLLPEKKQYEPGENARFQVRMPFPQASVLVTVEREGVLESFVRQVSRDAPSFTVPMRGNFAPNVFVSALAVRGRVDGVAPTALIDLGKPAFKMGVAEVRVGWAAHELKVKVATDRPEYKVRQKAQVTVDVRRADGSLPPKGSEIALAAVDEGLLELLPNTSWSLLDGMMRRRGIEVETATAQMQVVGKRHFGRKALPSGGGGGRQSSRELFDTLLFWQARVKLDDNGHATASVPLNDSLTRFRIVAVANGGQELFGTGAAGIRASQDLMLLSGLPPLVREQDRFHAGFTARNASDHAMELVLNAKLTPSSGGKAKAASELKPLSVSLAPGEAKELAWDVTVPMDADSLKWEVSARDSGGDSDRLSVSQKVIAAVPVRTLQATLMQLAKPLDLAVKLPDGALPGRGGIRVSLRARLADELAGVREYMERYPYTCLEQQSSQAVALRDDKRWQSLMAKLPTYLDGDGLAKYFPAMTRGSDSLSTYVLALAHESGREIPAPALDKLKQGLVAFIEGRVVRYSDLPTADLAIRKLAAMEALSRYGPVDKRWLDSISIEPNLWPSSAVIDWISLLQRAPQLPQAGERLKAAQFILRSRLNFQGTTMGFATERSDALWWLMISGDVNANRAILTLMDQPEWQADMARLVRGSLGRQIRGHWNTTVANAWGVLAMDKFSAKFESTPVAGQTRASLGNSSSLTDWSKPAAARTLPWPDQPGRLQVSHNGSGAPWLTVQSLAALPLKEPLFTGYKVSRSVSAVDQKSPGSWHKGDVVRVHLDLEAQSDMTWVVVNDPIPAGATILGSGLGGDSRILSQGEKNADLGVWPAYQERTFDGYRAYYNFVPKGKWSVEYTLRLNNDGEFQLPPSRVEAMYAPEMFGELPNAKMTVAP